MKHVVRSFSTVAAIGITVAALAPGVANAHVGASKTGSKTETFTLVSTSESGPHSIIATGAFAAGGDTKSGDNADVARLSGGTLAIRHPGKDAHFHQHVNHATCYLRGVVTGTYTVGHGTGDFAGITGHGHYTSTFTSVLARSKSGACDEQAAPDAYQDVVVATGPISGKIHTS